MVFDNEYVLLSSFDDITMEMCLRSFNFSFGFILDNFFGQFLNHRAMITVLVEEVEMLFKANGIKLS